MKAGRRAKRERDPFGQRLYALREQAGLSQHQLADRLGLTQRAYPHWERHPIALRTEQPLKLAEALNMSVEDLVRTNGKKKRGNGPTGKVHKIFEEVSKRPGRQQEKIVEVVSALVIQYAQTR